MRRLVDLFPGATPMRIPIAVIVPRGKGQGLEENTAIEYGTSKMVFFESRLPLELEDRFHLQNSDGSLGADAIVVGLHFIGGRRAIAARLRHLRFQLDWGLQRCEYVPGYVPC